MDHLGTRPLNYVKFEDALWGLRPNGNTMPYQRSKIHLASTILVYVLPKNSSIIVHSLPLTAHRSSVT